MGLKDDEHILSANINAKWLDNIYDNIKRMEEHERLAREGCSSLLDYLSIPVKLKQLILADVQFKNIRFFVTEFHLLLSDLTPILTEEYSNKIRNILDSLDNICSNRNIFVKETTNTSGQVTSSSLTPFFHETIRLLSRMKVELFKEKEVKKILYIENTRPW